LIIRGGNMKKTAVIIVLLMTLILNGCNSTESKITEKEAKSIVVKHHSKHIGKVKIISVTTKFNKYIIEWENQENCEKGIDSVNKKGEIKMIEGSIC
jgi:type III secretory pathway lipoprotein EscJ